MAMVNCPACKKIVSDASGKCPNCGASLKSAKGGKTPAKPLGMVSSALITASFILMLIEFAGVATTYISGVLLGVGFILHGVNQASITKEEGRLDKRKILIIYIIGAIVLIGGIFFLYLDIVNPVRISLF